MFSLCFIPFIRIGGALSHSVSLGFSSTFSKIWIMDPGLVCIYLAHPWKSFYFLKKEKRKKIFLLFTPIHSFLPPSSALHCAEWLLIQFIVYFCFPKNNILKPLFLDLSRNRIAHDSINLLFIMKDHKSKYSYFPLHLILLWSEIAIRVNYRYSVIYFYIT